ncbi:adenylate/guanylate cyclase domain-containing protein [Pontibacter sp. H259]|uniref:adenylate/guanylate cyclase domain-containing protein n=1 Tax=Pontibacter sp. H259 TaxID=3133421 RepID=UPI0030BEAE94
MDFYKDYTNTIKAALSQSNLQKGLSGTRMFSEGTQHMSSSHIKLSHSSMLEPEAGLLELGKTMGLGKTSAATFGEHPDFKHLKGTDNTEQHYITSVFIDIKGSTNLHRKYDLPTIYTITNTIQRAAIHTCALFHGHIQRLQGDGLFVYFGGKSIGKDESVQQAVNAASFFTYFVKNDLKQLFEEEGVEDISTRIGIDFGDHEQVMWANFGLGDCCELTTNSLHTSLASKMQAYASANGVVIGDHVKQRLKLSDEKLFDYVRDSKGEVSKRYIFEDQDKAFRYTQYTFDWYKYLKSMNFLVEEGNGKLRILSPEERADQQRIKGLMQKAALLSSGSAFTDRYGNISANSTGIQNQPHRFHYDE